MPYTFSLKAWKVALVSEMFARARIEALLLLLLLFVAEETWYGFVLA
jgi:hypothetical protein